MRRSVCVELGIGGEVLDDRPADVDQGWEVGVITRVIWILLVVELAHQDAGEACRQRHGERRDDAALDVAVADALQRGRPFAIGDQRQGPPPSLPNRLILKRVMVSPKPFSMRDAREQRC
jgi:hypothetical protein